MASQMTHDYQQMLRLCLEMEGALRILIDRPCSEAHELLEEKIIILQAYLSTMSEETPAEETPFDENPADETPADETPAEETPAGETPADETPADETPADETPAEETIIDETPTDETTEETIVDIVTESAPADDTYEINEATDVLEIVVDRPAKEPEPQPERIEDMIARKEATSLMRAFTINDKFRFTRELFEGDRSEFDQTMQQLAECESLGEVYDYLLNDLGWDTERDEVKDFISIAANYFNSL